MKTEKKDMKSCFTCRLSDAFIMPNKALFNYGDIRVECVRDTSYDMLLIIGGGCEHYEPCCNHKITLKEN